MRKPPVLQLDCDGVLYQLSPWVLDTLVNPQLGTNFTEADITDWKWSSLPEAARAIFYAALDQPDCWHKGEPFPGVVEDCRRLALDYRIFVVTAMRQRYSKLREAWLDRVGIPFERLIVSPDKLKVAREIGAVAAVDDYAVTASILGRANIPTWLVARSYNQFAPIDNEPNIRRGTWSEGVTWLERYASRLVAR